MSRPLRLDFPGAFHHVTARGNARDTVYRDNTDRTLFLGALERAVERFGWCVLAHCLMGNHYHLLVETPQANLSRGMRHVNGVYAQRFNRRHARVGHVFQARFHATLVDCDAHLLAAAAYVVLNPVRARLCQEPADWRWSSYRATVGLEPPGFLATDRLLGLLAESRPEARRRYRAFVHAQLPDNPFAQLDGSTILGDEAFVASHTAGLPLVPEIPRIQRHPLRPSLGELLAGDDLDAAVSFAYRRHGYTMAQMAAHLGVHYATVSRGIHRHEQRVSECKT